VVLPKARTRLGLSAEASAAFEANTLEADIFHFHSVFMVEHNMAARHTGAPYAVSPHGAYHPRALERSKWRKLAYRHFLDQRYVQNAAFVHALTSEEAENVRRYACPRRIEVIPNPVQPADPITPAERAHARLELGIAEGCFVPVYVGRLDPEQKGLDLLIDAVRDISRRLPVRLLLAGPPAGPRLDALLRPGDPISLMPPTFGAEKRRLLAAADVFASPSRWEGQPAAVLEALAHGLPVLISPAAGLTSFVQTQDAGVVVAAEPRAIADSLEKLAQSPSSEETRKRVSAATHDAFGPEPIARRFIEAYESVT
jgi:glycosyltransferase involved in cell wall biosynthesis